MVAGLKALAAHLSALLQRPQTTPARTRDVTGNRDLMGAPVVTWPPRAGVQRVTMACPNCGSPTPKPLLLTINFATLPGSRRDTFVLRCPDCTCPFYASQIPPDYAEDAMLGRGRVPFYLQQGAGVSLITRPLAQLRAPPGSTYVEVGCGFGFGLDYACHAKGWQGRGIDPAGISALGEQMLGVSIERRYLADDEPDLAGTCDVVMSSETIEHVLSPTQFARTLRSMLRPGGTLILTTPDGADLRPETAPNVLIGLLSPGLHLIFQTSESLHAILRAVGFSHIDISKDGHSLVAFASDQPLELETDHAILRAEYRDYLEKRAADFAPQHDLYLAFAGRALQEAANDGAFAQARRARTGIEQACVARFGETLDALGARAARQEIVPLEELATRMPLSLGGLLYADCMLRLSGDEPRPRLATRFLHASAAADLLRTALADLALADGMSEEISWTGQAEAVLCAAAGGAHDIVARMAELPPAPDAEHGAARRQVIAERALVEMVNASHYPQAMRFAEANNLNAAPWSDPANEAPRSVSQRDALFCLAVLDSHRNEPAIVERCRDRFHRVQALLGARDGPDAKPDLFNAARSGEADALDRLGRHTAANRLRESAAEHRGG